MKKFLVVLLISLFCFIPVNAKEEKYKIISGDIYDVGSEICFDTECFYVIENNGNIVKMLAKYNLYAGGFFDYYEPDYFNSWKEYGDEATGIQDSSMGEDETGIKGAAGFWSGDRYWLDENNNFKKHYGSESPTYVYDSNCDMYKYVENYHKYLESLSIPVHKTRLISFQELEKLGCNGKKYSCENAPNWVYSTAYWSGSASHWEAWGVTKYKSFDNWSDDYNYASRYGIRPVIEVPVSYFGDEGVIYIGSINKNNTSDGVVSNSDHNVDLIFNELGQSVKYQTTIYNTKNKNMYVNDIVIKNSSEKFIRVRLDTKSENMIIEPNGSSLVTFYIETALEEGAGRNLNDNVTIDFIISDKNFNPETFSNIIEFIILIIILCTVLFLIKSKKKKKVKVLLLIVIVSLCGVTYVNAKDYFSVLVEGNIKYESQNNIISTGTVLNGKKADYTNSKEVWAYYNKVKNVKVKSLMNKPKKYFKEFDLTENKTGKVMAYLIENGDSKVPYDLVIMSNGVVVANDDSSFMFSFPNIEEIEGLSNIDFRETTTMKGMFIGNEKLDSVDVKSIEMDNVIDVSYMFFGCDNVSYTKLDFELNDVNSLLMFTDKLYDEIKVSAKSDLDLNYQSSLSKGIYFINSTASNEFPIYFYRGNIKNNNVLFGGFCWKIVRTTDTGGIKLIYNGIPSVDGSCNSTGVDTQIGTSVFNSKTNFIHSGYMYGVEHSVKKESIRSYNYGLISELSMNNNSFYYSDSLKYENNMYVLNDPVLVEWNNNYNDLIGKYTCLNGTSTSCSSASVVVDSTSSKMMYARLFNGEILDNIAISKKYIINSNGEFELVDPLFISYSDWYKNYMSYVDYFSCFNSNITSNLKNIVCKFGSKISNESKSTYIATTYLKGKDILFGSDVKYENGVYTLIDTVKVDECYYCDRLNTYLKKHYTCFDNDGVCTNVYYIKKDGAHMEYFTLTNGEKIDDILQKNMTNMYDSDIKKVIDNWFEYSLINYTNDLEDTIWCNDRSISEENYFDINYDFSGGIYLKFGNYRNLEKNTFVPDFKCSKNDSFTVNDNVGNGNLKYPIGLLTAEELSLAGHGKKFYSRSNYLYSGTAWWTMTPSIDDGFIRLYCMYSYTPGKLFEYQSTFNGGVRPAVSLKHDISYSAGDGTVNNPYIIE